MRLLGSQSTPVREIGPVDVVDDALRVAARREFFTPDEALELLHRAQACAPEGAADATIGAIVADAAASYADQMMLARRRLVDPLLDIRLVLCD